MLDESRLPADSAVIAERFEGDVTRHGRRGSKGYRVVERFRNVRTPDTCAQQANLLPETLRNASRLAFFKTAFGISTMGRLPEAEQTVPLVDNGEPRADAGHSVPNSRGAT